MKKGFIFSCGTIFGFGLGIAATKLVPKTKPAKYTKFIVELFKLQLKLGKILDTEYYMIDEEIMVAQMFINSICPNPLLHVTFTVIDEDGNRHIRTNVKKKDV